MRAQKSNLSPLHATMADANAKRTRFASFARVGYATASDVARVLRRVADAPLPPGIAAPHRTTLRRNALASVQATTEYGTCLETMQIPIVEGGGAINVFMDRCQPFRVAEPLGLVLPLLRGAVG